jgi:hypothetical protein
MLFSSRERELIEFGAISEAVFHRMVEARADGKYHPGPSTLMDDLAYGDAKWMMTLAHDLWPELKEVRRVA